MIGQARFLQPCLQAEIPLRESRPFWGVCWIGALSRTLCERSPQSENPEQARATGPRCTCAASAHGHGTGVSGRVQEGV